MEDIKFSVKKTSNDIGIIMRYINKDGVRKRKSFSLRKVSVTLGVIGLAALVSFLAGKKIKDGIDYQNNRNDRNEKILEDLDADELFIEDILTNYSICLDEYEGIMKEDNHNEAREIDARVNLVSATRDLVNIADNLVENKVLDAMDLDHDKYKVSSKESFDGVTVTYSISVDDDFKTVYYTNKPPKEITDIIICKKGINAYKGDGDNQVWRDEINSFNRTGKNLYDSILNLTTKTITYENDNIVCNQDDKHI